MIAFKGRPGVLTDPRAHFKPKWKPTRTLRFARWGTLQARRLLLATQVPHDA
jgi:hypothetical protein